MPRYEPLKEKVDRGIFTDREETLAYLWQWAGWVGRRAGKSEALIGHRRLGKTAILRRFYNDLFWEQEVVTPFYLEMPKEKVWLRTLAIAYYREYVKQYLAFQLREPELVQSDMELDELEPYLARLPRGHYLIDSVPRFQRRIERGDEEATLLFHTALEVPSSVGYATGQPALVMIDEFQYFDQYIYLDEALTIPAGQYSGAFSSVCEYLDAPMLVAGSQVTLTAQQTLNGGLAGRFGKTRIGPLTPEAGMELALRLARHYDLPLTARLAYEVSRLAGGHPYYIERALLSAAPDKDLTTPEGLAAVFDYEVREGRIRAFWSEHFEDNLEALGGEEARRLLFYVLQWERETPAEEQRQWGGCEAARAAESLGLEPEVAYALLRKLARADVLIEDPAHGLFHSFRDEILERCLRLEYEWQIRGLAQERMRALVQEELQQQVAELEQEVRSLRGRLNETLGREAEVTVQRLMKQGFRNQQIGGPIFHVAGKVRLPEFLWVKPDRVVGNGLEEYQLDNVGMPVRPDRDPVWITEQKNWAKPVSLADVRKFARTVAVYCRDRNIAKSVAWLYGRSGFTAAAHKFMEQEGILYSDLDNLLVLAEKLGLLGL